MEFVVHHSVFYIRYSFSSPGDRSVPRIYQCDLNATTGRYAIVVSRFNESITSKLLDGALDTLLSHGVDDDSIDVAWVPGAWEIPIVVRRMADSGRYVAILALGAVIRGETSHDQHINRQVSESLGRVALDTRLPVLFGILTCNSLEQAIHRSGGTAGNKGVECAEAALRVVNLISKMP